MTTLAAADRRIGACFEITPEAARVVRATLPTDAVVKLNGDVATRADRDSGTFILSEISKRFPDDTVITEENAPYTGTSGFIWLVDPLDGTLNFQRNMGPWAVSVALLRYPEVLAGCIVEGSRGDVFTTSRGGGALRNDLPIRVSTTTDVKEALIGFDCPYDQEPRMGTTYGAVGRLLGASKALRCYGSCAAAMCMIATGELDAYAVEYGKSWDFAAGTLLVREAGGAVTTWRERHYYPEHNTQVLATNGLLHSEVATLISVFART
jgi:myo-inositol-1(or 4)-monophosphatase